MKSYHTLCIHKPTVSNTTSSAASLLARAVFNVVGFFFQVYVSVSFQRPITLIIYAPLGLYFQHCAQVLVITAYTVLSLCLESAAAFTDSPLLNHWLRPIVCMWHHNQSIRLEGHSWLFTAILSTPVQLVALRR